MDKAGKSDTPEPQPLSLTAAQHKEADQILAGVRGLLDGIQATFGRSCEVVLHDYRDHGRPVIAIAGKVTGGAVGPATDETSSPAHPQDDAAEKLNYPLRLPDGRLVKSSTIPVRLRSGRVVGALCIYIDVTDLQSLGRMISEFVGGIDRGEASPAITFTMDKDAVIEAVIAEVENEAGHPRTRMTTADWTAVVRALDEHGLFQIKHSVPLVAKRLGLSRASVYNYIARARAAAEGDDDNDADRRR